MRPYILLSLWADDDAATKISHGFALRFHQCCGAEVLVEGDAPAHDALRQAADAFPDAAIVIFAHGGPALSARREGPAWIQAECLAEILSGRRVYAFACSTFVPQPSLLFNTFARRAVDSCVDVFAGHEAPVMTPFADEGNQDHARKNVERALSCMIESFINGENDNGELIDIGRGYASWDLPVELDLPSEDPACEGAFGWSSAAFLGGFFKSLRVLTKADVMPFERDQA